MNTYIIDIDGCIFKAWEKGAAYQFNNITLLPGVIEKLDEIIANGDYIVLMTARPESLRQELVSQLRHQGVYWCQLIMGVTSGMRIIVNDTKPGQSETCQAITLIRNKGLCALSLCELEM